MQLPHHICQALDSSLIRIITYLKFYRTTKKVPIEDFKKYIEELAKSKKIEPQELLDKLTNCGSPSLSTATKAAHANVVDRLTDRLGN